MDLTIKLTIAFSVVWAIAVVVEMVWFSTREEDQDEELGAEVPDSEASELRNEVASEEKTQAV